MKKFRILLMIPLVLMLTSCVGEEPNNIAYVTALGIDKTSENYLFTIQFANPIKISGGAAEEGGPGGQIVENVSFEAPTIYSAINSANSVISKDLSLAHAKVIVVSEELAKNGIGGINDVIARNNEIRPDIYLSVAENAQEYLEAVQPMIELNPVRYYQLMYESKSGSAIPRDTAADFYMMCISGDRDCILPLSGVAEVNEENTGTDAGSGESAKPNETSGSENKSESKANINEGGFENKTKNFFAGQAGVKIKNKSEVLGLAVFKGDKYVGKIGSTQAEIYNILMGYFKENNVTFYSEKSENPITIKIEEKIKPIYRADVENRHIDIEIILEGELVSASPDHRKNNTIHETDINVSNMINNAINEFINEMYKELNVDVLGIRGKTKRQFSTIFEYERFAEKFVPSEWEFDVKTDFRLKQTGMTDYY